jgi:hypothetical protein
MTLDCRLGEDEAKQSHMDTIVARPRGIEGQTNQNFGLQQIERVVGADLADRQRIPIAVDEKLQSKAI